MATIETNDEAIRYLSNMLNDISTIQRDSNTVLWFNGDSSDEKFIAGFKKIQMWTGMLTNDLRDFQRCIDEMDKVINKPLEEVKEIKGGK